MRTLVIDCATEACSVALFKNGALLAGESQVLGRGHAEALVPMIRALPDKGRAERIAISRGPGSFTGIRVGLAAGQALALAWQAELAGYPTLALIAAMAREEHGATPVSVVMNGGHGQWFVEKFNADGGAIGEVASLDLTAAVPATTAYVVAGNRAEALVSARGFGTALNLLPDARCFALLPDACVTADISPLYGRAPDARLPNA